MLAVLPAELQAIDDQLNASELDANRLVDGLDQKTGQWRAHDGAWSVAECLDHLATANRVYLQAMQQAAIVAQQRGRLRTRPALPGIIGSWFAQVLEPPVKPSLRVKAVQVIKPRQSPPLTAAFADFLSSHPPVRVFLQTYAHLDLARIRFRNPLVRGVRFSLATGLHVITAHERRHLWQAWNTRRAAERGRM